jgi:hypothetical protein
LGLPGSAQASTMRGRVARGLTPKRCQSGEVDRSGAIAKTGDGLSRAALFVAATFIISALTSGETEPGETPPWMVLSKLLEQILAEQKACVKNMHDAAKAFHSYVQKLEELDTKVEAISESMTELLSR